MKHFDFFPKVIIFLLISFIALSCEKDQQEQPDYNLVDSDLKVDLNGCPMVTDLIAGQHYDVGDIIITNDQANIYVTYLMNEPGWYLKATHMHVAETVSGIPQNRKGNPKVGHFEYQMEHNMALEYTITVPHSYASGTDIVIAAHAVVDYDHMSGINNSLPATSGYHIEVTGGGSYFNSVVSNGGDLTGEYYGWCIDAGHVIYPTQPYLVNVYSSTGDLTTLTQVDHPENLDKVNWLINQGFIGQPSTCCDAFTYMDIQHAIWNIVDDFPPTYPGNPDKLEELVSKAFKFGEGYEPGCDDIMAVVMEPYKSLSPYNLPDIAQVTIIEVAVSEYMEGCDSNYGEETAWGLGDPFSGNSWAMYMNYTLCEF